MKCVHSFSFVLFALLGVFFGSFIITQNNSYAVSDISVTYSSGSVVSQWDNVFPSCTATCLDNYSYLIISNSDSTYTSDSGYFTLWVRFDGSHNRNFVYNYFTPFSIYKLPFDGHPNNYLVFGHYISFTSDVTYTLTTSYSSGITPSGSLSITENGTYDVTDYAEVVVDIPETDCPPSSGGDYHDDLVAINNSILVCAGVCLMIYFFYCIYRMFIKPLGGR